MAYTYIGTPNQRIQQAQQRISNDGSVAINPTLSAYMQAAQQEQVKEQTVEQQSKANFGVRLGDTLGDVAKNTLDGMLKAGEGLLDFGAGAVGMFAGWFGNEDLKQRASDWAARDLVGEMWESGRQKGLDVDFEDSYINEMSETGQNIVRGVAQGVGQMLPMVAVTLATGGAGGAAAAAGKISAGAAKALNTAGKAINLVGLGMSAAGTSTERALNTDIVDANGNTVRPSLDRAFLYGLASGAVEMATEKLVGGVFEKFTGTGLADKVINKLSKSVKFGKAVQFGLNVVGEGVEEMVSEAVGKTLETIYNSSDGKMHWESPDMQDVIVSGIVGSLTAAVMGGADVGVRKISNVATAQDAMLDYENTQKKADNLARQGKLTAEDVAKFDADNAKTLDTISRRYQRASENGRAKMKASIPGIMELLNEDGTVKKIALVDGATEITADSAVQAMSGSLAVSRRTEVANALKEQNLTLAQNLDNSQKTNMSKLEQVLKLVGKKTGQTTKVVVAEHMPLDNAHTDGDIMYISKDRLSNVETMAQDVAHEAFHFAEGTDEYRKMVDFFGTIRLNGESLVDTAIDKVRKLGYDVDDGVFDAIKNGENVSSKNTSQVRLAFSEINAKMAELLLGDAETINKLIERDRSLARKVLSNIRDYAKIIEMTFKGDAEGIETLKQMRKAIKLYEDALAASGAAYYRPNTTDKKTEQKETEAVKDGNLASQMSIREIDGKQVVVVDTDQSLFEGIKKSEYAEMAREYMREKYRGQTIEGIKFTARSENEYTRSESAVRLQRNNNSAYESKMRAVTELTNFVKTGTFIAHETAKHPKGFNVGGYNRYAVTFVLGNVTFNGELLVALNDSGQGMFYDIVKIKENGAGYHPIVAGANTVSNNSIRQNSEKSTESDIKYSLREDSEGRKLSKKQAEFFRNSKVVDENGNLLVVYHGTREDFNAFKNDRNYFTDNIDIADSYAPSGKIKQGYLKVENPYIVDAKGEKWSRVPLTKKDKAFLEKFGLNAFYEDGKWRTSPADIVAAVLDQNKIDALYDGIIIKNIDDTGRYWKKQANNMGNDFIVFDSSQFKNIANMTTVGIQMMDNWMNRLIWNACQCEVEKRTGLKFGTKENMIEAGKLHAEVGRMTQGNNARSELSAMQRSSNALAKMYSMFNSDGFKYISRLYEAAKRASAYKYLNKTNPGTISQQKVRSAHVFMAKAATAIIVSNLVYVLMGQLMKFALNKDREDEEGNEISFWQDLGMDFASSMVGMIPIVRDIYSLIVEGYDVKDNATEGIMNLAESIKDVIESSMTMIKGDVWDSTDIAKPLKSLIDAMGQVFGIPTRNVYNYVYGLTKRFSPSAAYEWNSLFYNNGYTKDLKKAIEKDDVDLQKTIIGLMLKDDGMTDTSTKVNERLRELYKQGYTVLPRTVKDTLNYNGETYSLSKKQQTAFKETYGQANNEVEKLIESRSFSSLSAEIQARAIKWIYDYYYENAVYETVGEDADSKNQLFGEVMDISRFAMTIAACKSVESKVDKKGNVVAGSKKQAILQLLRKLNLSSNEILMILAYLGYSIEGNEQAIKNFIGRIGLTRSQQKSLLKYCGIAA